MASILTATYPRRRPKRPACATSLGLVWGLSPFSAGRLERVKAGRPPDRDLATCARSGTRSDACGRGTGSLEEGLKAPARLKACALWANSIRDAALGSPHQTSLCCHRLPRGVVECALGGDGDGPALCGDRSGCRARPAGRWSGPSCSGGRSRCPVFGAHSRAGGRAGRGAVAEHPCTDRTRYYSIDATARKLSEAYRTLARPA